MFRPKWFNHIVRLLNKNKTGTNIIIIWPPIHYREPLGPSGKVPCRDAFSNLVNEHILERQSVNNLSVVFGFVCVCVICKYHSFSMGHMLSGAFAILQPLNSCPPVQAKGK